MKNKIDWMIHYVQGEGTNNDGINYNGFPSFANIHTHGLIKHNHKELCLVLALQPEVALGILNECGLRIVEDNVVFSEGENNTILANDYRVKIMSFDDNNLYILLPDENNLLPGDEGCKAPYCFQETYAQLIAEENKNL